MKKDFPLSAPHPCHEQWGEFTPTEKGRFCGACQKEVIDFTHLDSILCNGNGPARIQFSR